MSSFLPELVLIMSALTLLLKLSKRRADKDRHATRVRCCYLCVSEREIAKDCGKNNLYVHSKASSDMDTAVRAGEQERVDILNSILGPLPPLPVASSSCLSDHLDQCGLWTKLPATVVC